jgi:hypothetical protein
MRMQLCLAPSSHSQFISCTAVSWVPGACDLQARPLALLFHVNRLYEPLSMSPPAQHSAVPSAAVGILQGYICPHNAVLSCTAPLLLEVPLSCCASLTAQHSTASSAAPA